MLRLAVGLQRRSELDGLRGLAALLVFLHHAAIYEGFIHTGRWALPATTVFAMFGPVGVGVFFMLTAYLFGSRVWASERADWRALYVSRIFRLGPLYVVVAAFVIIGALFMAPRGTPLSFLAGSVRWLLLGILAGPDLNGFVSRFQPLAGVTRSLQWEWAFYAALPLIAPFRRRAALFAAVVLSSGLALCAPSNMPNPAACVALFGAGLLIAGLPPLRLPNSMASGLVLLLASAAFAFGPAAYSAWTILLLGGALALIAGGCSVFGLLTCPPVQYLGRISYGLYLLQGPALMAVFLWPAARQAEGAFYWLAAGGAGVALLAGAHIAHVLVEKPGMRLGKALLRAHAARLEQIHVYSSPVDERPG